LLHSHLKVLKPNIEYKIRISANSFFTESLEIKASKDTALNIKLMHIPMNFDPLPSIYFEFNNSEIRNESKENIKFILDILRNNPTVKLNITSFSDSLESKVINAKRLENIYQYLIEQGVDTNNINKAISTSPNKHIIDYSAFYNCNCKCYIDKGELITETYIQKHKSEYGEENLRRLNRCISFSFIY
jgi:hypothetical protein